jgi:hypothetical protein
MPKEENEPNPTRGHSFDELAKGLASGSVSRRQALRLMGGALLGGMLASIPGLAQAVPRGPICASGVQCLTSQECCVGSTLFTCCGGVEPPLCCLIQGVKGVRTPLCVTTREECKAAHGHVVHT